MYDYVSTPAAVVELDIAESNIRAMVQGNMKYGISHRPHIKVHKSIELAKLQLASGARGITCAKVGEAEIMARGGIRDILIAFPLIGEDKTARLGRLLDICDVKTIVNSDAGARGLSRMAQGIGRGIQVLVDVDGGLSRGGRLPGEDAVAFAESIRDLPGIEIVGLMGYYPAGYTAENWDKVVAGAQKEREDAVKTAEMMRRAGFSVSVISAGTSFSAKCPDVLQGVTEVRAGNYIFNDGAQLYPGFVKPGDCALRVVSTVVAKPAKNAVIIDAGSKALTSDQAAFGTGFGYVMGHPEITIHRLNEEHGFLKSDGPIPLDIGQKIAIIPNHACVVPNLSDEIYGARAGQFDHMIRVDARGKSQ